MSAARDTPFTEMAVAESEGLSPPEYSCQTNNNHINANEPPPPYASLNGNVITQQPHQAQTGANDDILQPSSGQELSPEGSEGSLTGSPPSYTTIANDDYLTVGTERQNGKLYHVPGSAPRDQQHLLLAQPKSKTERSSLVQDMQQPHNCCDVCFGLCCDCLSAVSICFCCAACCEICSSF